MLQRRPLPVPRRRPHRRAALAAGAVGALVLVPASGAFADDVAPPDDGDATQPLAGDVELPSPEVEDQVDAAPEAPPAAPDAPDATDAPDGAAPDLVEAAPPVLSADPAAAGDEQAAAAVEPYFGVGKPNLVLVEVFADDAEPSAMAGAQVRVDSDMENPTVGTYEVIGDGTIDTLIPQGPDETLTFTLVTPPPGYMTTSETTIVLPPCDVPELGDVAAAPLPGDPPACAGDVEFEVVEQYRTLQLRAVDAAGAPVPGVTFELHSPLAPLGAASVGGGTAAVTVPGRSLLATAVTPVGGVASLSTTVPPGADYLVVPTAVPDGFMLPPSMRLDLAAVSTVAEADAPVVMTFTLVPALAATGSSSSWPLAALASGLLATGAGLVVTRRRLEHAAA